MEYELNAENKISGRLATEVATLLRGKNNPAYNPSRLSDNKVVVFNTDKLKFSGKKTTQKLYRQHSGFHGGLKEKRLDEVMKQDSRRVLKMAVMGMLPKNKLRSKLIKNLIIFKGSKTTQNA